MKRFGAIVCLICGLSFNLPAQDVSLRFSEFSVGASMQGSALTQISVLPFKVGVHEFNLFNYEFIAFPNGAWTESWRPEYRKHFPLAKNFTFAPSIAVSTNLSSRFCPIIGASLVYDIGNKDFSMPLRVFTEYRTMPYTHDAIGDNGRSVSNPGSVGHKIFVGFSCTLNLEMGLWLANWIIQNKAYDWDHSGGGHHRSRSGSSGSQDNFSGHRNR